MHGDFTSSYVSTETTSLLSKNYTIIYVLGMSIHRDGRQGFRDSHPTVIGQTPFRRPDEKPRPCLHEDGNRQHPACCAIPTLSLVQDEQATFHRQGGTTYFIRLSSKASAMICWSDRSALLVLGDSPFLYSMRRMYPIVPSGLILNMKRA